MQDEFLDGVYNKYTLIKNVNKETKKAINDNAPIILVELDDSGNTSKLVLTNKLFKYKKLNILIKDDCDGSKEIISHMLYNKLPAKKIKVCGIFSTECVQFSVGGLLDSLSESKICVIKSACSDSDPDTNKAGIDVMRQWGAIII